MGFPWTLQRYIFREMGKTFLLTAAALTGVLGLGGGVLEMVELGEVTAGQLLRLMGLVLPVAAALTLPVAALFSAAATYGRLSADNEFVACRSSGINLHVLFFPAVVLSLGSAAVTFVFINFLIPGIVRNLNEFVGADVGTLIQQRLQRPRGLTLGKKFRIYADDSIVDAAESNRVVLQRVAFVEVEGEEWIRYGTTRTVDLRFDRDSTRVRASGSMSGLSFYDRRAGRFADLAEQVIPPNELPTLVAPQIKFLNLAELLRYAGAPTLWHEVADAIESARSAFGRRLVYDAVLEDWRDDRRFTLNDPTTEYVVQSSTAERLPRDTGIELTDVSIEETRAGRQRSYMAARATLDVSRGESLSSSAVRLEAFEVKARDGQTTVERIKETFPALDVPAHVVQRAANATGADLLALPVATTASGDPLSERIERARNALTSTTRKITATISERMAFSISVVVLVILGAALGIVLRGAHAVIAFGISFVPSVVVIITIVTGRQMACNAGTHYLGLILMWAGLGGVAALDGWTLTRLVRR